MVEQTDETMVAGRVVVSAEKTAARLVATTAGWSVDRSAGTKVLTTVE